MLHSAATTATKDGRRPNRDDPGKAGKSGKTLAETADYPEHQV